VIPGAPFQRHVVPSGACQINNLLENTIELDRRRQQLRITLAAETVA
jgi:hypothetical protein